MLGSLHLRKLTVLKTFTFLSEAKNQFVCPVPYWEQIDFTRKLVKVNVLHSLVGIGVNLRKKQA
jgi:hypothetical protein